MGDQSRTRIVIIGAGKGGTALLELFIRLPHVEIVGIADMNPGAPGLHRAEELGIPTSHDAEKLISNDSINLIVDVTDDSSVQDLINRVKRPDVEVAGGATSKLLWDLVQHEADMQSQLFHSEKLASIGMKLICNHNYFIPKNWLQSARLLRGLLMISITQCI
jgi:NADH/NAD ratio-sensing transcriptional regulator Rex